MGRREENQGSWTLLTGHGHVLVEIARDPTARIRDIAAAAGVTERTAQSIVADLEAAGYLTRQRAGRRAATPSTPPSRSATSPRTGTSSAPFSHCWQPRPALRRPASGKSLTAPPETDRSQYRRGGGTLPRTTARNEHGNPPAPGDSGSLRHTCTPCSGSRTAPPAAATSSKAASTRPSASSSCCAWPPVPRLLVAIASLVVSWPFVRDYPAGLLANKLAVHELAANAVRHGAGSGLLSMRPGNARAQLAVILACVSAVRETRQAPGSRPGKGIATPPFG